MHHNCSYNYLQVADFSADFSAAVFVDVLGPRRVVHLLVDSYRIDALGRHGVHAASQVPLSNVATPATGEL